MTEWRRHDVDCVMEPFSADEFNGFERELGQRVRDMTREAMALELAKADVDVDCVLPAYPATAVATP